MAQNFAVMVYLPVGVADTVTSAGATSTSAVALPANATRIMFSGTEGFAAIFGSGSVAAADAATCYLYQPDTDYVFDVQPGVTHYRAIRTGSSDSSIAVVKVA